MGEVPLWGFGFTESSYQLLDTSKSLFDFRNPSIQNPIRVRAKGEQLKGMQGLYLKAKASVRC